jgi:hypothetical protein
MAKLTDTPARAEATIKKEQQAREGEKAWGDYQAQAVKLRERTARLRALRLSKEPSPVTKTETPAKKPKSSKSA